MRVTDEKIFAVYATKPCETEFRDGGMPVRLASGPDRSPSVPAVGAKQGEKRHVTNSGKERNEAYAFFNEVNTIDLLCKTLISKILPDGVHPSHFAIILHLVRLGDEKTPQALAGAMEVSKATMSHSLKVLEKRGFIEIRPCDQDARSKLVYLTDSGRHFHSQAIAASARTFGSFLKDEHRQAMVGAMPTLVTIRRLLDENREPVSDD
ncbi:MarR family winged helix-turn-helix transcriptional regulator [Hoeflea alexandrii]|nr:MarR family transcriptional regulator [Hoeflea alexandrii]MCY0151774.1 MarR family transcriptional regulator [Hoeflea alexandrii]